MKIAFELALLQRMQYMDMNSNTLQQRKNHHKIN